MLVRYGRMNNLGLFEHEEAHIPHTPARVVVKTDKGLELGHIVGQLSSYKEGRFRFTEEQICCYFANSDINFSGTPVGKFIRYATADDVSEEQHLTKITEEEIACCERFAQELGLKMRIIDAEHIFGGERIVFYFMADGRVDFRELVRRLAQEYQTRIEMRQIGSRDEAKLLGDVESCGQQCCCIRFLQLLKPVNMRMAKMQKATLDPSKISGYCGRLKCCLRYEDENYMDLKRRLPKRNTWVQTKRVDAKVIQGRVIDTQILTQLVVVEQEGGERVAVPVDDLKVIPAPPPKREGDEKNGSSRRRGGPPPRRGAGPSRSGESPPRKGGSSPGKGEPQAPKGESESRGKDASSRKNGPRPRRPRRGGRGRKQ
jgi:cell fate regulator YaaT (PSP1 superfamily)